MTVSNRLKRFKQFKPQSAKNTMGTVLKENRGSPIRLLPPRDFRHQNDSHPMVHDSTSSGHTFVESQPHRRGKAFLLEVSSIPSVTEFSTMNVPEI
jgi:hypothetical protein